MKELEIHEDGLHMVLLHGKIRRLEYNGKSELDGRVTPDEERAGEKYEKTCEKITAGYDKIYGMASDILERHGVSREEFEHIILFSEVISLALYDDHSDKDIDLKTMSSQNLSRGMRELVHKKISKSELERNTGFDLMDPDAGTHARYMEIFAKLGVKRPLCAINQKYAIYNELYEYCATREYKKMLGKILDTTDKISRLNHTGTVTAMVNAGFATFYVARGSVPYITFGNSQDPYQQAEFKDGLYEALCLTADFDSVVRVIEDLAGLGMSEKQIAAQCICDIENGGKIDEICGIAFGIILEDIEEDGEKDYWRREYQHVSDEVFEDVWSEEFPAHTGAKDMMEYKHDAIRKLVLEELERPKNGFADLFSGFDTVEEAAESWYWEVLGRNLRERLDGAKAA